MFVVKNPREDTKMGEKFLLIGLQTLPAPHTALPLEIGYLRLHFCIIC